MRNNDIRRILNAQDRLGRQLEPIYRATEAISRIQGRTTTAARHYWTPRVAKGCSGASRRHAPLWPHGLSITTSN